MNENIIIQNFKKFWESKSTKVKRSIVASLSIFILLTGVLIYLYTKDSYNFLLTTQDATVSANVISKLKEQGVQYDVRGTSIYVANANPDELKLELSGNGTLSSNNNSTIDLFTKPMFLDETQENQIVKKDLENNLSNTIKSYGEIVDASVILSLGKESSFKAESIASKAAIKLNLKSKISNKQVNSIQKLVAAAVPNLIADDVVITDNDNNLLSSNSNDDGADMESNDTYVKSLEDKISGQINDMLTIAFPNSNFKVVSRIQMNFDKNQVEKETVQSGPDTIVSTQTTTETEVINSETGQAGTESNVPSYQTPNSSPSSTVDKSSEIINYDLNKVKEQIIKSPEITQMSVAVIADKELTPQEESKIKELVSTAALINTSRGDMVSIQGFDNGSKADSSETTTVPTSKYFELLINKAPIIIVLIAILVILFRLLSLLKKDKPAKEPKRQKEILMDIDNSQQLDITEYTGPPGPSEEELNKQKEVEQKKNVRNIIQSEIDTNPQKVASILRTWKSASSDDDDDE